MSSPTVIYFTLTDVDPALITPTIDGAATMTTTRDDDLIVEEHDLGIEAET